MKLTVAALRKYLADKESDAVVCITDSTGDRVGDLAQVFDDDSDEEVIYLTLEPGYVISEV